MNKRAFIELLNKFLGIVRLRHIVTAIRSLKILEIDMGHSFSSKYWESASSKNKPIPWLTYPAIHFLNQLDLKNKRIFEYGSGNSTLYWTARAKYVESVENNYDWYTKIKAKTQENKNLLLSYLEDKRLYVSSISRSKKLFDLIIIDGRYRFDCAKEAASKVKESGIIIVDNSERYPQISKFLMDKKFAKIDFCGFGPINHYTWTTSVFFYKNISFKYSDL